MPSTRTTSPGVILTLACAAQFVVILDLAIVNVALPSIQAELGASDSALQWVVIAYGLTLGGGLLLGGRLADLFGHRLILAIGLVVFALASLAGGVAGSLEVLVLSRAVQGAGGALALPAALAIVSTTFPEGAARNKALGIFGAVGGSAGSIGVIAGGVLTSGPGWEWVFLINVPIGIAFAVLVAALIPVGERDTNGTLDVAGAITVTSGLMALVYAINRSVDDGWSSAGVIGFLVAGLLLLASFVVIESRVASPLVPPSVFRHRRLTAAIAVSLLLSGSFFAVIFNGTLFMQQGLGYSPIRTGGAWLAATCSSVVAAGVVAPRVVGRIAPARTLVLGQVVMGLSMLRLAWTPSDASYWVDLFPSFLGMGVGMGFSLVSLQIAAFSGIDSSIGGLAGGLVETSREVGGAVGVAAVATLAAGRVQSVLDAGGGEVQAITAGYRRASVASAVLSLGSAALSAILLRRAERDRAPARAPLVDDDRVRAQV